MRAPASRRPRRGFALVAALALLVVTSVVALELAEGARARRLATANAGELAAARAAAMGGLETARVRLLYAQMVSMQRGRPDATWRVDPWASLAGLRLPPLVAGELRVEVRIDDAGALLPLSRADETQLRRLMAGLHVDAARAERAAQSIMDWSDGDALHRLRGAERDDYLRMGAPVLPADAPFDDVATLRHVAGVGEPLYALLRPWVRVVGGARVNLNTAGEPVLLALPGMTPDAAALVLRWRRMGRRVDDVASLATALPAGARARLLAGMPALLPMVATDTREVIVTSVALLDGVERARAEALMVRDNGVRIGWRRVSP
jgi:type II secretory pathway component PulK